jgi:hypothetical protein
METRLAQHVLISQRIIPCTCPILAAHSEVVKVHWHRNSGTGFARTNGLD